MEKTLLLEQAIAFRLGSVPPEPIFVGARSAGFYRAAEGWRQPPKTGNYLELFWCANGVLEFPYASENRVEYLHGGEAVFQMPGDLQQHRVMRGPAVFGWLTLDGHAQEFADIYCLNRHPFPVGNCPTPLFRLLIDEIRGISPAMRYRASATALTIVHLALGKTAGGIDQSAEKFYRLVEEHYHLPSCSVESLAELMGVSRVTLYRTVREAISCTPKEYLDKFRLGEAVKLLLGSRLSILEIALRCGYANANYFSKAFRAKMAVSPEVFRRSV